MDYTGLDDDTIEAIEARNSAIRESEREIKAAIERAVRGIIYGLGTGVLLSMNPKSIEAARKTLYESIAAIIGTKIEKVAESAMKPAFAPLKAVAPRSSGIILEYGFEARKTKIITKAMQYERYGHRLSERIWNASDLSAIEKILKAGYGQDVKLVAKQLEAYIRDGAATLTKNYPNMMARMGGRIPGNMAYESLRLARAELATMYRDAVVESCIDNPAVLGIRWLLANTHPIPDVCDDYAMHDEGLGRGVFIAADLPDVPHPLCLCAHAPVTVKQVELERRLQLQEAA
jgi:hypothetical protein